MSDMQDVIQAGCQALQKYPPTLFLHIATCPQIAHQGKIKLCALNWVHARCMTVSLQRHGDHGVWSVSKAVAALGSPVPYHPTWQGSFRC